jgi:hypothetical protein
MKWFGARFDMRVSLGAELVDGKSLASCHEMSVLDEGIGLPLPGAKALKYTTLVYNRQPGEMGIYIRQIFDCLSDPKSKRRNNEYVFTVLAPEAYYHVGGHRRSEVSRDTILRVVRHVNPRPGQ